MHLFINSETSCMFNYWSFSMLWSRNITVTEQYRFARSN